MVRKREANPGTVADVHLVILVHGINTHAHWMNRVQPVLEEAGFAVSTTSYGRYGLLRFLIPFIGLRRKPIERVLTDIITAIRVNKPSRTSIISHSFGSYVVSRIMAEHPEHKWHRIIFCGSVVREDFELHHLLERFDPPILNEVGAADYWPALAESVTWGYGSVGSTGFNRPPVRSRWHANFRHSDFLTRSFTQKYWVPFLRDGTFVAGDEASALPWWIGALTHFPLRWTAPIVLLAAVGGFMMIERPDAGRARALLCGKLEKVECEKALKTQVPR